MAEGGEKSKRLGGIDCVGRIKNFFVIHAARARDFEKKGIGGGLARWSSFLRLTSRESGGLWRVIGFLNSAHRLRLP